MGFVLVVLINVNLLVILQVLFGVVDLFLMAVSPAYFNKRFWKQHPWYAYHSNNFKVNTR